MDMELKEKSKIWTQEETEMLEIMLRKYGTDFQMLSSFFPKKTKNQIKVHCFKCRTNTNRLWTRKRKKIRLSKCVFWPWTKCSTRLIKRTSKTESKPIPNTSRCVNCPLHNEGTDLFVFNIVCFMSIYVLDGLFSFLSETYWHKVWLSQIWIHY